MSDALILLNALLQDDLVFAGLVFLRIGGLVAFLPVFGERTVPVRVKLAIAAAFTIIVAPMLPPEIRAPQSGPLDFAALAIMETGTGIFFGLILRFFVVALQIAGSVAAQSTSLSQIFGGTAGADPQPAMSHLLVVAGLALAALLGLHVEVTKFMVMTYRLVPFGDVPAPEHIAELGVAATGYVFALGVALAGAYLVGSLTYNATLGVVNRAMPQLMVSFIGAPAITAGGLLVLFAAAPLMLGIWIERLARVTGDPGYLLQ